MKQTNKHTRTRALFIILPIQFLIILVSFHYIRLFCFLFCRCHCRWHRRRRFSFLARFELLVFRCVRSIYFIFFFLLILLLLIITYRPGAFNAYVVQLFMCRANENGWWNKGLTGNNSSKFFIYIKEQMSSQMRNDTNAAQRKRMKERKNESHK